MKNKKRKGSKTPKKSPAFKRRRIAQEFVDSSPGTDLSFNVSNSNLDLNTTGDQNVPDSNLNPNPTGDTNAADSVEVVEGTSKKADFCLTKTGKDGIFFGSNIFVKSKATYSREGKNRSRHHTGHIWLCSKYKLKNCRARIHVCNNDVIKARTTIRYWTVQ